MYNCNVSLSCFWATQIKRIRKKVKKLNRNIYLYIFQIFDSLYAGLNSYVLGLAAAACSLLVNISTVFRSVFSACHHQFLLLSRCVRRKISIIFLPLSSLRQRNECAGCCSIHLGPSINNVIHFLRFLTPLSPMSPILLKAYGRVTSPFGRSPSP